mmetsp:Transcript_24684/g.30329  ORF Transcript_24684/g.30329 Transcript_24684/m.30329 type:complete len:343 (-) Transcript_24684:76-1104(-)
MLRIILLLIVCSIACHDANWGVWSFQPSHTHRAFPTVTHTPAFRLSSTPLPTEPETSLISPSSDDAQRLTADLGLSPSQHLQIVHLCTLICEWNDRINLVSRKDCSPEVVFHRHVLPSLALSSLLEDGNENENGNDNVVDVGTGGGFPGLPLAILHPQTSFLLVDSVNKKLTAIDDMITSLALTNVQTLHTRVEEMATISPTKHKHQYGVVLGRSVTSIPRFCFWIKELLVRKTGKMVYITGGDLEDFVEERCFLTVPISGEGEETKRALVINQVNVDWIAGKSGEKSRKVGKEGSKKKRIGVGKSNGGSGGSSRSEKVKGKWDKKDNSVVKDRGYEDFRRY